MNVQDSSNINWFQTSLEQAISSQLPSTPSMSEVKSELVSWKQQLNALSASEKAQQITYAIKWLTDSSATLSLSQMKLCLRLIEDVALSPRISTLSKRNFLHRYVSNTSNRALTLTGLENYIQAKYPQLKIFYFNSIPIDFFSSLQFKENLIIYNEDIWLVFQHGDYLHKTLLKLSTIHDRLEITILDSLGITHDINTKPRSNKEIDYRKNLRQLVELLSKNFTLDHIKTFSKPRQQDGVNCAAFIVFDLETALNLTKEGKALFSDLYDQGMHADFFKITQFMQDTSLINPNCLRKYNHLPESKSEANCQALLVTINLFNFSLNNSDLFVKEKANLEEVSDEDKEDGCSIM